MQGGGYVTKVKAGGMTGKQMHMQTWSCSCGWCCRVKLSVHVVPALSCTGWRCSCCGCWKVLLLPEDVIQWELLGKAAGWGYTAEEDSFANWLEADKEGLLCPFLGRMEVTMLSGRGMVTPARNGSFWQAQLFAETMTCYENCKCHWKIS